MKVTIASVEMKYGYRSLGANTRAATALLRCSQNDSVVCIQ